MNKSLNISQSLVSLGLDKREAELYTYLLKQPKNAELTVFLIAKNLGMPRSTVYLTLQGLEAKRLVSSYKKNNVLHYLTADPIRLTRDLEEKKDLLTSLLPTLQNLSKDDTFSPSVRTFTGAEGVRLVFDEIYNEKTLVGMEFHTISHPKLIQYMPKKFWKYMELKKKYNVHTKMLSSAFTEKNTPKEYVTDEHRETRFLPTSFSFEGTFVIYSKKTALFSYKDDEVYSMIIDSPAITEMLDGIFMCLWNLIPH